MAIIEEPTFKPLVDESDPDDYRPDSSLAFVIDPSTGSGTYVESMTVLFERMAVGDRIPLHTHTVDELIVLDEGAGEVILGEERRIVGPGAVVFVPAGVTHGTRNVGDVVLRLHAVFPSRVIPIRYLERNPAPGTEADPPQPPVEIDVRELLEGDPDKAVRSQLPGGLPRGRQTSR